MAEKFQKVVATPEQAAAKLRRKIAETQPVEYVRRKRAEKNANGETIAFNDAVKMLNDGDKKPTNEFDVYAANHAHTQNA